MTLDDEAAELIARETTARGNPWSGRYAELVQAGYAHRDAEVEELRARRDWHREQEAGLRDDIVDLERERDTARATLAKVREWAEPFAERYPVLHAMLAILDESPAERETPADEWEYGSEAIEDDGDGPRPLADDKGLWPDGLGTGVHDPDLALARQIIDRWQNARLIRRRKAGTWEVVPDDRA